MTPVLVSIALCTYNGERFLTEQLDSIINQTYRNLEIIVVDDRSADATIEIAKSFAAKDDRIKVYENGTNLGYNKNFERALRLTTGSYIAISDQDDIWEADKIQKLVDNIGNNWLIFSNSVLITADGSATTNKLLSTYNHDNRDYRSLLLMNVVTGHTCLMEREFLQHILPFPDAGFYDWWMGFIALYNNKLIYLNERLTRYRLHESSVIQKDMNNDKQKLKRILSNTVSVMIGNFTRYKGLNGPDKKFITDLNRAYNLKFTNTISMPLIRIVNSYYRQLFPDLKERKGLSKLNFAIKYSRKIEKPGN
ncbi:glycosyltransferase [Mucilaginibacter sp.]|jgi:glycosyltransferase involved in cell wall biosynthesis|uniref:glycosyltransferase n=1 Tax=Mucilaginibacter sp. TaxID=1882438 RepID=UPI0035662490